MYFKYKEYLLETVEVRRKILIEKEAEEMPSKTKKFKWSREEIIYHVIVCTVFAVFTLACIYPFYYLMINTVSNNKLVEYGNIILYPKGIHFGNYVKVLGIDNLLSSAIVTVLRVIIGTVLSVVFQYYMAYFFTRQEMWHRKIWYRMVVATMYFNAGLIPVYLFWTKFMNLDNNFLIYILPRLVVVYNVILIKTSIEATPKELEESAYVDGAGYLKRAFLVVLPLQKPILATVALFSAVEHWNDWFTTKLYVTDRGLYTLQYVLYEMMQQVTFISESLSEMNISVSNMLTPVATRLTLTAIIIIPIMCVYPFVQKFYIKGVMIGAVKG